MKFRPPRSIQIGSGLKGLNALPLDETAKADDVGLIPLRASQNIHAAFLVGNDFASRHVAKTVSAAKAAASDRVASEWVCRTPGAAANTGTKAQQLAIAEILEIGIQRGTHFRRAARTAARIAAQSTFTARGPCLQKSRHQQNRYKFERLDFWVGRIFFHHMLHFIRI